MEVESMKLLAAAIALLPMFGVGIGLGMIFSSYNEAVGRNPTAAEKLDQKFFVSAGLTEAIALFAFGAAFYILVNF